MDSLTHIALGVCVGEVVAGKQLGKKSWLVGAGLQTIPDLDFIAGFWLSPAEDLLAHRGFTHSFLFAILLSLFLASLLSRIRWGLTLSRNRWLFFCLIELFIHDFLDAMNVYGTAWLEPFSHARFAFNVLFVADPFFTTPLLIGSLFLLIGKWKFKHRQIVTQVCLSLSVFYLIYAVFLKWGVDQVVKENFAKNRKDQIDYFSTPTPFNPWLWYVVGKKDSVFKVGYFSVFDTSNQIYFSEVQQQKKLLPLVADQESLAHLIRFSQGYYTLRQSNGETILNDLRFGQIMGWANPAAPFVFYFYLQPSADNKVVIQRGRLKGWSASSIQVYIKRIFSIYAH